MTSPLKQQQLINSLHTGFIDKDSISLEKYCPKLLLNNHKQGQKVLSSIINELENCDEFFFSVAFITYSGVLVLLNTLKELESKGVRGKIVASQYLNFTDPTALRKLLTFENIELRMVADEDLHSKGYIFRKDHEYNLIVGSSNLTQNALSKNKEWNIKVSSTDKGSLIEETLKEFEQTFNNSVEVNEQWLEQYELIYHRDKGNRERMTKDEERLFVAESTEIEYKVNYGLRPKINPNKMQVKALRGIEKVRERGENKALLISATGIGKTYLAAFDSKDYEKVLFVAHREEILKQAAISFKNVRRSDDYGYFMAGIKDIDKSVIFASVASLGKNEYLSDEYFHKDFFDYIVIDEFHHAVNDSYKRIIEYFNASYLLGLTATPDRMDGRNVYELCDYIVPYEISLKDAINKGVLVPFHYYGIYDETVNYTDVKLISGRYEQSELDKKLLIQERYELIYKHYMKYRSKSALGFCSSIKHSQAMVREFRERGIPCVAVHSGEDREFTQDRELALRQLRSGEIKVIFSVDMFNEGVDIPSIDMVMFLRPTESPVVFLQQLGRGLRRYRGKEYLNVLDFIGNYRKAGSAPFLLSDQNYNRYDAKNKNLQDYNFPENCHVDFDLRLIDLFKEMAQRDQTKKEYIEEEYFRIKELKKGKVPTRMELLLHMEEETYDLCMKNSKLNPFRGYLKFLHELKELDADEEKLYHTIAREFINLLEITDMQKSYKMPLLEAFYNNGQIKMDINDEDVYKSFKQFYNRGINGQDLIEHKGSKNFKEWGKSEYVSKAKSQPIKALLRTGKGYFIEKEGYLLSLNNQLEEVMNDDVFISQMKDVIDYRTMEYYRRRYKQSVNQEDQI